MDYVKEAEKLKAEYAEADCGLRYGWCDTKKCPLWGDRKGRWDGLCVTETYLYADNWIGQYEYEIRWLEMDIDARKNKIKKLKSFKKRFEEWMDSREK